MIVHIGYPKCASTSMQCALSNQSEVKFLGCNPKAQPGSYYEPEIGNFFEKTLRLAPNDDFQSEYMRVKDFLVQIDAAHNGRSVLSYENLSLRLTPWDLPTDIKLQRLSKVLPDNSSVLLMYRPVPDVLLSLYKNYLSMGYTAAFSEYLRELLTLGSVGLLEGLDLSRLYRRLTENFDPTSINFIVVNHELNSSLQNFFGLSAGEFSLEKENIGIANEQILNALEFNRSYQNWKCFTDWLEMHRMFDDVDISEEERFMLSRFRHKQAEIISSLSARPIEIVWPNDILELEARNLAFLQKIR